MRLTKPFIIIFLAISIFLTVKFFPHIPTADEITVDEQMVLSAMERSSGVKLDEYIEKYPEFEFNSKNFYKTKYRYEFTDEENINSDMHVIIESVDKVHFSTRGDYYDLKVRFEFYMTINNIRTKVIIKGSVTTKDESGYIFRDGPFLGKPEVDFKF